MVQIDLCIRGFYRILHQSVVVWCYQVKSFRIFLFQVIREIWRSWCGWLVAGELSVQLFSLSIILCFDQHKIDCIEGIRLVNKPSTSSNDRLPLFYSISCPCLIECRFQIIARLSVLLLFPTFLFVEYCLLYEHITE